MLDRKHVDLERRDLERWLLRAGAVLFAVFLGLGLANVFGQRVETTSVDSAVADGRHVLSYDSVATGTSRAISFIPRSK